MGFQLKRFSFEQQASHKLEHFVEYDPYLSIESYAFQVTPRCLLTHSRADSEQDKVQEEEIDLTDGSESPIFTLTPAAPSGPTGAASPPHVTPSVSSTGSTLYELIGIIEHIGETLYSGHYVAYLKREDKWYSADDSRIFQITVEEALHVHAYMLFYQQCAEPTAQQLPSYCYRPRPVPESYRWDHPVSVPVDGGKLSTNYWSSPVITADRSTMLCLDNKHYSTPCETSYSEDRSPRVSNDGDWEMANLSAADESGGDWVTRTLGMGRSLINTITGKRTRGEVEDGEIVESRPSTANSSMSVESMSVESSKSIGQTAVQKVKAALSAALFDVRDRPPMKTYALKRARKEPGWV